MSKKDLELEPFLLPNAEDFQNDFDSHSQVLLGSGSFGQVYKIAQKNNPANIKAIKIVQCVNQQGYLSALKEVQVNRLINIHPNIIHFEKIYAWSESVPVQKFLLVFQMKLALGSLKDLIDEQIQANNKTFNEQIFLSILEQLITTFHFLLNKNLYHRDVKPQNILFEKENNQIVIRITDFGVSKALEKTAEQFKNTLVGTALYLSPKLWEAYTNGQSQDVRHNLEKSDVYSLGITLLQTYLLLSDQQISGLNDKKQDKLISLLNQIQNEKIKQLLTGMIQYDEKQRFNWEETLNVFNSFDPTKNLKTENNSLKNRDSKYHAPINYGKCFSNKAQTITLKLISQIFQEDEDDILSQIMTIDSIIFHTKNRIIKIDFDGKTIFQKECQNIKQFCVLEIKQAILILYQDNFLEIINENQLENKPFKFGDNQINYICPAKEHFVLLGLSNGWVQILSFEILNDHKIINTFKDSTFSINYLYYDKLQDLLFVSDISRVFSVRYIQQKNKFSYLKLDYLAKYVEIITDTQIAVSGQNMQEILILEIITKNKTLKLENKFIVSIPTGPVLSFTNLSDKCLFISTEKEIIISELQTLNIKNSPQSQLIQNDLTQTFIYSSWNQQYGYLFTNDGYRITKWTIELNQQPLFGNLRNKTIQKKCKCCCYSCSIM